LRVECLVGKRVFDLVFGAKINGYFTVSFTQQVFGEVQACVGEPLRGFDIFTADQYALTLVADDVSKVPDLGPEGFFFIERPLVKRVVVVYGKTVILIHLRDEARHVGRVNAGLAGSPQGLSFSHFPFHTGARFSAKALKPSMLSSLP
jgi:hypothetical protein